jgi:hypothetical protein
MLTKKDLRDIAAYLNSCTCSFPNKHGYVYNAHPLNVDALDNIWGYKVEFVKLNLRSFASLTDEEFCNFFTLAFPSNECQNIERCGNGYYNLTANSIWLQIECGPNYAGFSMEAIIDGNRSGRIEAGSAIAYLQSIGVYVPGTIDPQYVELQP